MGACSSNVGEDSKGTSITPRRKTQLRTSDTETQVILNVKGKSSSGNKILLDVAFNPYYQFKKNQKSADQKETISIYTLRSLQVSFSLININLCSETALAQNYLFQPMTPEIIDCVVDAMEPGKSTEL